MRTSAAMAPSLRGEHRVQVHLGDLGEVGDQLGDALDQSRERLAVRPARAPRTPFSISAAWMPSSIDSASSSVAGARRNVMSFSTSTSTPPRPNATSLPNEGSVTAPTMTSWPPVQHLLHLHADDVGVGVVLLRVGHDRVEAGFGVLGALDADEHAAGLGLVQDVGRDDLQHDREAHALGELGGFVGGLGDAFLRHRDAVGVADVLAFGRGQRRAAVGLDLTERRAADDFFGV